MRETSIDSDYLKRIGMAGDYEQIELNCEICDREQFETILKKGKIGKTGEYGPINIVQCNHCGHVMLNPRFEKRFYLDFYRNVYKDNVSYLGGGNPPDELIERQQERGRRCFAYIQNQLDILPGTMLDLGCAYGATLIPFIEAGWLAYGIDPEEASVEFAQQTLKLPVDYGFAEELPYETGQFNLVISLGALEHVHDFAAAMNELSRTIKPGGYLFIRMRHNRPWGVIWEYFNRNHYRFFCGRTHRLAVMRYGFDVITLTDEQIEGRTGDRYLFCRKVTNPSLDRVKEAIASGIKDTPDELKQYLNSHHKNSVERAKKLLNLEERLDGNMNRIAEEITSGRFNHPLLYGYTNRVETIERALSEARILLSQGDDHGIAV